MLMFSALLFTEIIQKQVKMTIQSNVMLQVQEFISARISNNIKHKQVDLRFFLDLICSHKQHLD